MKKMILLSLVVLFITALKAQAEVYECSSESQGKYLVALQNNTGILFRFQHGYFQDQDAEVKVARAMDGGPLYIVATDSGENDWSSGKCFTMTTETHIVIRHRVHGDTGSTIQYIPKFILNPDQTGCDHRSVPRPLVLPPQKITCLLK